ncbi:MULTISPECIES: hypothetical protein [unclassified Imperialibacter]|uniref:hypothetical protein n=1 Tax=unclassified Imperialibacter TaxID=2629706 RepID=UPI00125EE2C1|nr:MULTISPECIES: hypothetical protein [unclassified Imperialibacter]
MKKILIAFSFLVSLNCFGQQQTTYDSVDVRIFNNGKHYIKEYIVTVNGKDFTFNDIWKNKYSEYQKLPYLWANNQSKTTVIVKKMIKYDLWLTTLNWPIDHAAEKKHMHGKLTIDVTTRQKADQLEVEEKIKLE